MPFPFGRKWFIRLTRDEFDRIYTLARPRYDEGETQCLECGGTLQIDVSPPYCDHRDDCPGMARYRQVSDVLYLALRRK